MAYEMKALSCDPSRIKGMSERLIVSHYENNYGGAVIPVLELDMYEHSYHIDFGAKAAGYVDVFMNVINWRNTDQILQQLNNGIGLGPKSVTAGG